MDLTNSYDRVVPAHIVGRYDWAETRNAASVMAASNPTEWADFLTVLENFAVDEQRDVLAAGGNQSATAALLNEHFRRLGWREGAYRVKIRSRLELKAWTAGGERSGTVEENEADTATFLIDNLKGRLAFDVEWHAKEGHLDRDLAAYRSLYDEAVIDGAGIITMNRTEMRAWVERLDPTSTKYKTSTATSLEKVTPKLRRGDGGGCPVLIAAVCTRTG